MSNFNRNRNDAIAEFDRLCNLYPALRRFHLEINGRLTKVLGHCKFTNRDKCVDGTVDWYGKICLAKWMVEGDPTGSQVLDTLRHECAHALLTPHESHGYAWMQKAKELGAKPCPYAGDSMKEVKHEIRGWIRSCPRCGRQERFARKPRNWVFYHCTYCSKQIADPVTGRTHLDRALNNWTQCVFAVTGLERKYAVLNQGNQVDRALR